MSKKVNSYSQKKRSSIVHKPFSQGQVNLFHPPKKNPNGHLASATLWDEETPIKLPQTDEQELPEIQENNLATSPHKLFDLKKNNAIELWQEEILEDLPEANREELPKPQKNIASTKPHKFFNGWKISAVSLIILSNLIAATAIFINKQKEQASGNTVDNSQQLYTSGKTDLTAQEFVKLDLNNLKNIAPPTKQKEQDPAQKSPDKPPENLPLAIPPTNLPQDIVLPQGKKSSQYYYILIEYTGDRSLEIAKAKVANVSLVNFPQGVFIYMGAFAEKEPARKFVKHLKESGLEGYIYPFE